MHMLPNMNVQSLTREPGLQMDDELVVPMHQRMVAQTHRSDAGAVELHLYHGDKEITFDEPELLALGERLAKHGRFLAGDAAQWAPNATWPQVREVLQQLLDEGVLRHADEADEQVLQTGERPSPLPSAPCESPRTWWDCEAVMQELTGVPLELGHLEMVMPIFRVAHMALDADGRQVGEANVFPPAMRLDVPTSWRVCIYPGTRFQSDRPMNVTALKAMRAHWSQMMAVLPFVRDAYLRRFPDARCGWTVGHLERLATAVLAVPTLALMRAQAPVANGRLHPALSSLFRVTDGLRMTMHQMLFVPIGEPTLSPDAPMSSEAILAYAERNHSFHSEHGVCAGPKAMVEEFLNVLVDGISPAGQAPVVLDADVQHAVDHVEEALDYALRGLQVYAAVFSLWPQMTRAYETLWPLLQAWAAQGGAPVQPLVQSWQSWLQATREKSYLANEQWRVDREAVYADMHDQCAHGLEAPFGAPGLSERLAVQPEPQHECAQAKLNAALSRQFGGAGANERHAFVRALVGFLAAEQAVLRTALEAQREINLLLCRSEPRREFSSADIDLHNQLQGARSRQVPDLVAAASEMLGVTLKVTAQQIHVNVNEPHMNTHQAMA